MYETWHRYYVPYVVLKNLTKSYIAFAIFVDVSIFIFVFLYFLCSTALFVLSFVATNSNTF